MQLIFWGVRGSYPVPGPDTVRYGGNTSCVEVLASDGERIIVDAGTGLTRLGNRLAQLGQLGGVHHLLLSHLHWDHIQGLPFFAAAFEPHATLAVHAMKADAVRLSEIVAGVARHEFFPTALGEFPAKFQFHEVSAGRRFRASAFAVSAFRLNHPFGALGYRIEGDAASCAYVCDTAPFFEVLHKQHFMRGVEPLSTGDRRALQKLRAGVVQAIHGCDTVVYDTHFTPEEYARFPHYGHSTPDQAIELCAGNGVRRLVLFHHAPNHHDAMMDDLAQRYTELGDKLGMDVVTAREGMVLDVGKVLTPPRFLQDVP